MNTFICFPLYVASRVFVQYLKSRPEDQTVRSTLHFLLSALNALKHRNPLTESFLIQLKVDLVGTGIETPDIAVKTNCSMNRGMVCVALTVLKFCSCGGISANPYPIAKPTSRRLRMLATSVI